MSQSSTQKKGGSTKRERMEERESAIVEAAKTIFVKNGIDGTRMAEIAAKANVAEGTLYLYFKNKTALLSAVVASHWEGLTEGTVAAVDGIDDVFEALHALGMYHLQTMIDDRELLELNFYLRYAVGHGSDQSLASKRSYVVVFDKIYARGVDRGLLRSDIPLWHARDLFFGTLEYSSRTIAYHGRLEEIEMAVSHLVQIIKNGYSAGSEATNGDNAGQLADMSRQLERVATQIERLKS